VRIESDGAPFSIARGRAAASCSPFGRRRDTRGADKKARWQGGQLQLISDEIRKMKIRCEKVAFPSGAPWLVTNGAATVTATWNDLVWAAVTVGRRNSAGVSQFGIYSFYELMYRLFMVYANLRRDSDGRLRQTKAYKKLDRSEKSAVSFFLGMAVAKLVADKVLSVPWLVHMSRFSGGALLSPDLVGRRMDPVTGALSDWLALEAKGRTNAATADTIKAAVKQAKTAFSLFANGGLVTPLRCACVTHFPRAAMRVHLEDPPAKKRRSRRRLDVSDADYFSRYYEPITTLIDSRQSTETVQKIAGLSYRVVRFEELDMSLGYCESVREGLLKGGCRDHNLTRIRESCPSARERQKSHRERPIAMGSWWNWARNGATQACDLSHRHVVREPRLRPSPSPIGCDVRPFKRADRKWIGNDRRPRLS
jgi:hypothetical protein